MALLSPVFYLQGIVTYEASDLFEIARPQDAGDLPVAVFLM